MGPKTISIKHLYLILLDSISLELILVFEKIIIMHFLVSMLIKVTKNIFITLWNLGALKIISPWQMSTFPMGKDCSGYNTNWHKAFHGFEQVSIG